MPLFSAPKAIYYVSHYENGRDCLNLTKQFWETECFKFHVVPYLRCVYRNAIQAKTQSSLSQLSPIWPRFSHVHPHVLLSVCPLPPRCTPPAPPQTPACLQTDARPSEVSQHVHYDT